MVVVLTASLFLRVLPLPLLTFRIRGLDHPQPPSRARGWCSQNNMGTTEEDLQEPNA